MLKLSARAIGKLGLGTYERVALEFAGNPLGLESDDLVFEKASSPRAAALLANLSGSTLCFVDVAGELREPHRAGRHSDGGVCGRLAGASLRLASDAGGQATHATRWKNEPWVLGAFSVASPGGQWARRTLSGPLRERVWFAGEAVHDTSWGTVGGAWEAGERAAQGVLRKIG